MLILVADESCGDRHIGSVGTQVLVLMDFYFPDAPLPLKTAVASTAAQQQAEKGQRCQSKTWLSGKGYERKMKKNEEHILIIH